MLLRLLPSQSMFQTQPLVPISRQVFGRVTQVASRALARDLRRRQFADRQDVRGETTPTTCLTVLCQQLIGHIVVMVLAILAITSSGGYGYYTCYIQHESINFRTLDATTIAISRHEGSDIRVDNYSTNVAPQIGCLK